MKNVNIQHSKHSQKGLSLVEVLVAMTLMTVLIVSISTPLAGLFQISKDSREVAEANVEARAALETARSSWQTYPWAYPNSEMTQDEADIINQDILPLNIDSLKRYNQNCVGLELSNISQNISFTVYQLDRNNEPIQALDSSYIASDCTNAPVGPQMPSKRIEVSVTNDEGETTIATHVDVRVPTIAMP